MLAYLDSGAWSVWTGQRRPAPDGDDYTLAANAEDLLSDDELAVYGLHRVAAAWPIPSGHRIVSTTLSDDGGMPRWLVESEAVPLAELRAAKLAALAARRWQAETAGITVEGVPVMSDRESQGLIVGAALQAVIDPAYTLRWKTAAGAFVALSATELLAVAQAVRAHVQACFDREAALTEAINAAADVAALDAADIGAGWPA